MISLDRSNFPKKFFGSVLVDSRIMQVGFSKLLQQVEVDIFFVEGLTMDVFKIYDSLVSFNCLSPLWSEKQILLIRPSPSLSIVVCGLAN